jgi:hypothetical protein
MIHGGQVERHDPETGMWNVPKVDLVNRLQIAVQNQQLKHPPQMKFAKVFLDELRGIRVKIKPSGYETFEHREGEHDDLVFAAALALWRISRFFGRPSSDGARSRRQMPFQPDSPGERPYKPDDLETFSWVS